MQTPPPPSQQQAADAQQARHAAELAILPLFTAAALGEGSSEGESSVLHEIAITTILAALAGAIVFTSFRNPRNKSQSLLDEKPDNEEYAQRVLEGAQRSFNQLLGAELPNEQRAALWATWAFSRTADEIARAVNSGEIPNPFSAQGLGLQKVWISRSDKRVRPLHADLHGKTIPTADDFWRWPHTGQRLRWPGDKDAPLDATIGCRCVCLLSWAKQSAVSKTIRKITEHTKP